MEIYALVGPSGTGKSHRAPWVAKDYHIDYIIDDGLLIKGSNIIAGKSAKKEKTKIGSVKTAVFTSDDHAFEVSHALKADNAEKLLILGTSDAMVEKIANRLGYPGVDHIIRISDIATHEEIQLALHTRKNQGKHEIPVPTMELKRDFSGFYLDPLNVFKKSKGGKLETVGEKSVVRPTFSYLGKYTISDYAIYQILEHVSLMTNGVSSISRFRAETGAGGIQIEADLVLLYGYPIPELLRSLKQKITAEIETLTSLNIRRLTLTAKSVILPRTGN